MPYSILIGGLATVLGFFSWPASRIRRRGLAGGPMSAALASYEEAFRITAHESHVEITAQAELKGPLLSPDGHWGGAPAKPERREPKVVLRCGRVLAGRDGVLAAGSTV
jgi:hypothetical protein